MTNAAEYPARVREAFPEAKLSVQSFRDRTVLVVEPADLHDILQHLKDMLSESASPRAMCRNIHKYVLLMHF